MFRYINMPKLVAAYLREFSTNALGTPSNLYKFVLCLCLPFISPTFRRARLNALAIAECTVSADQIKRVLYMLTGAEIISIENNEECMVSYTDTDMLFAYSTDTEGVPYGDPANSVVLVIRRNEATASEIEQYLTLLVPFYVSVIINYV